MDNLYKYDFLPENVFGHSKKVALIRASLDALRTRLGRSLKVLDIGCGNGFAVSRLLAHPQHDVLAIDLHEPCIKYANNHFAAAGLRFACMPAEALKDKDDSFDAIVLADVLEHLQQPEVLLNQVCDLLSPHGRVLISIPNGRGPFELESALSKLPLLGRFLLSTTDLLVAVCNKWLLRGRWTRAAEVSPDDLPYNDGSPHVQFFRWRPFQEMLKRSGLTPLVRRNLSVLSGPFTNYWFTPFAGFCRWNARMADHLPSRMVSAWYMELACAADREVGPV